LLTNIANLIQIAFDSFTPNVRQKSWAKQCFCLFLPPTLYKIAGVGDVLVTIFASIIISFNFNCPTKHTQIENKCLCLRANLRPITQLARKGALNLTDFQQAFAPLHEKLLIPTK
jgi:hypothetical protein